MTNRTFFALTGIVLVLIGSYFAIQLTAQPAKWCLPRLMLSCMVKMESECGTAGLDHTGEVLVYSWCENGDCIGWWSYYCGLGDQRVPRTMYCIDENHWQCENS